MYLRTDVLFKYAVPLYTCAFTSGRARFFGFAAAGASGRAARWLRVVDLRGIYCEKACGNTSSTAVTGSAGISAAFLQLG